MENKYLLLLVALCGCSVDDNLHRVCPSECYNAPEYTAGVGQCVKGVPICDSDFQVIDCIGEVVPSEEVCDGVDNRCLTGIPDEGLDMFQAYFQPQSENPCASKEGECMWAKVVCSNGKWECEYPPSVELGPDGKPAERETLCDSLDNNCKNGPDDGVYDGLTVNERSCYSGNPPDSYTHPPCRAGWLQCVFGQTICQGEVLPQEEKCGQDLNCNGVLSDAGTFMAAKYDMVFSIDTSGSMAGTIGAVILATENYVGTFSGNDNFKFALVVMSEIGVDRVRVEQDFTDLTTFRGHLLSLDSSGNFEEASYDAIYKVCDLPNNPLALSWRPDAIALYLGFTDEPAQSYEPPLAATYGDPIPTAETDITTECADNGVAVYQWATIGDRGDFDDICAGTSGTCFDISNSSADILNDLNSIILQLCGG